MKVIYIPCFGDLYQFIFDDAGNLPICSVSRDNCSRPPQVMDVKDLPPQVMELMINKLVQCKSKKSHGPN